MRAKSVPAIKELERVEDCEEATASTTGTSASEQPSRTTLDEALAQLRAAWQERNDASALAACEVLEGLLRGVKAHLPELPITAQLDTEPETLATSLQVQFLHRVRRVIATRSRIGYDVLLQDEVSFSLSQTEDGVQLHITGLEFHPLEDAVALRRHLQSQLKDFTRESCYQWWEDHKEEMCPLNSSKLRWILESILGLRSVNAVTPPKGKEKMLWGFLHTRRLVVESFHFRRDEEGHVRMRAKVEEPISEEERALQASSDEMIAEMPSHELKLGEYFMPSSMNWLELFHYHLIGHPGADPAKITKLLSGATSWGCGADGWHQYDETWTCVDQKTLLGKTTLEQGRVIWHQA